MRSSSYAGTGVAAALAVTASLLAPAPASAADAERLPPWLLFVVSGGAWSGGARLDAGGASADAKAGGRGYYRIVASRGADNQAHVYLEQMALQDGQPVAVASAELKQIDDRHGYVTDIRQDASGGSPSTDGFSAFVTLKTNPKAADTETWTVAVDEFGKISVGHESN
ncbi:MAG: hypothetical protein ACTHJ3_00555 [Pararhizobium sp.]